MGQLDDRLAKKMGRVLRDLRVGSDEEASRAQTALAELLEILGDPTDTTPVEGARVRAVLSALRPRRAHFPKPRTAPLGQNLERDLQNVLLRIDQCSGEASDSGGAPPGTKPNGSPDDQSGDGQSEDDRPAGNQFGDGEDAR